MTERRLPLTVRDGDGVERHGELLIVPAWRPDIAPSSGAAFAIVLVQEPADQPPAVTARNTVVCFPAHPVALPKQVGEPRVAYAGGATAVRMSRSALEAYAAGQIVACQPALITPREVFFNGPTPRLDALVREIMAGGERAERYWRALDEALALPHPPEGIIARRRLVARLRALLSTLPGGFAEDVRYRVIRIVEGHEPAALWSSPAFFAEDVALARCLAECVAEAHELLSMRRYLDGAVVPEERSQLHVDALATREQLSFITLLVEPQRLASMRATFEGFRATYAEAYLRHHQRYWERKAQTAAALAELEPLASALRRLNTLRALGRPLGREALAIYSRLVDDARVCGETGLAALREMPRCPTCSISLADAAAHDEIERLKRQLEASLARQQSRLAGEAVRRILACGGERLDQFLRIVQASDQSGLVRVLDDELVRFIRELLDQPLEPSSEALALFEELARAYPSVSADQLDDAVETFRRLLADRLSTQVDGDTPATIRLAGAPAPRQ